MGANPNTCEQVLKSDLEKQIGKKCKIICWEAVDNDFKIIRKEFSKQCVKLFDKILYGSGGMKALPGFDAFFARRWNKFMKHYYKAIMSAFLCGDLNAYLMLLAAFWGLTLHFKPENRCHDLSNVLCSHITKGVKMRIPETLKKKHPAVILVNINLLFKPEGLMAMLKKEGWKLSAIDARKVSDHRSINSAIPFIIGNQSSTNTGSLQHEILKTGTHGKAVLGWGSS